MAVSDLDIFRTANVLIQQHGQSAVSEAKERLEEYKQAQNNDGICLWTKIVEAVIWLSSKDPAEETVQ